MSPNLTRLILIFMGILAVGIALGPLLGCSSTPYREYNSEDKQSGSCYATYGGIRGYCNAIEEEPGVNDVFDNNCLYDEEY